MRKTGVFMALLALLATLAACGGQVKQAKQSSAKPKQVMVVDRTFSGKKGATTDTIRFTKGQFVREVATATTRRVDAGSFKQKGQTLTLTTKQRTTVDYASAQALAADGTPSAVKSTTPGETTTMKLRTKALYAPQTKATLVHSAAALASYQQLTATAQSKYKAAHALDNKVYISPQSDVYDSTVAFKSGRFIWRHMLAANSVTGLTTVQGTYQLVGSVLTLTIDAQSPTYRANMSQLLQHQYESVGGKLISAASFTVTFANNTIAQGTGGLRLPDALIEYASGANVPTFDSLSADWGVAKLATAMTKYVAPKPTKTVKDVWPQMYDFGNWLSQDDTSTTYYPHQAVENTTTPDGTAVDYEIMCLGPEEQGGKSINVYVTDDGRVYTEKDGQPGSWDSDLTKQVQAKLSE